MSDAKPGEPAPTPKTLKLLLVGIWVFALIFLYLARNSLIEMGDYVKTIKKDSIPSIITADEIAARMSNANAAATSAALANGSAASVAWIQFDSQIDEATDKLVDAAQNITYDEERAPILQMLKAIPKLVGETAVVREIGGSKYIGDTALARVRAAVAVARTDILPQAKLLQAANLKYANEAYVKAGDEFYWYCFQVLFSGALVLGLLAAMQYFLVRRFHRMVNPLLLAATIAIGVAAVWTTAALATASTDLKVARKDAFDSIDALWKARAMAYDADADQTLALLEPGNPEHEKNFNFKAALLLKEELTDDALWKLSRKGEAEGFHGFLADEMNNITFDGEREAAIGALDWWQKYRAADKQIRDSMRKGNQKAALEMHNQAQQYLSSFQNALAGVIGINKMEFDKANDEASTVLDALTYTLPVLVLASLFAASMGIWQRIREYA